MNTTKRIKPISYVKSHAAEILQEVHETQTPYVITQHGEAKAVLIDTQSYDSLMQAMGMLKLLQLGEHDITQGRVKPQDDVFLEMEKKFDL